jgi:probable rRNA maturation factor
MSRQQTTLLFEVSTPGVCRQSARSFAMTLEWEFNLERTFCCVITSDKELRRLNREFLNHDWATDVLSFPSGDSEGPLGDIAISFTRAKHQAKQYGHRVDQEVDILMLHGLLHLLGMDHETDNGQMAQAERKWREKLGLPAGLIERVSA